MDHAHSPERSESWFRRTLARICSAQLDGIVARHTCLDSCMEACKPVCIHACLPNVQNSGMVYLMRRSFAFRGAAMHRRRRLQSRKSSPCMEAAVPLSETSSFCCQFVEVWGGIVKHPPSLGWVGCHPAERRE